MSLTLRQLEIFAAVAKHHSVSKAAKALGLSQPAVSKQIHQMEKHLGVPVIEIIRQRVHITPMGQAVLGHAKRFDELLRDLNNTVMDKSDELTGDIRVSTGTSLSALVVHSIARFIKKHPKVSIKIDVGSTDRVSHLLLENKTDVLIAPDEHLHEDLVAEDIARFQFIVVAHKKNPLVMKRAVSLEQLAEERWLRYSTSRYEASVLGPLLDQYPMIRSFESNSIVAIKCALNENLGVAILPDYCLGQRDTSSLRELNVNGFPVSARLHCITRRNQKLTNTMSSFLQFIRDKFSLSV